MSKPSCSGNCEAGVLCHTVFDKTHSNWAWKPVKAKMIELHLVREEREAEKAPELGKMVPHFQTCGFPLKKQPAGYLVHSRQNGDQKISIKADPDYGMPFGADILTLLWCFTKAIDDNSRVIHFKAAAKILHDMGLATDGRNYRAIIGSFERIFGCKYTFEWGEPVPGKGKFRHTQQALLFDELKVWFNENDQQMPLEGEGFENEITLSEFAWNWLKRSAWFETGPAYALRQMPGAIQLFLVIAARGPKLRRHGDLCDIPISGPQGLDKQIGGVLYEGRKRYRWEQLLGKWLTAIKTVWPECPAELVDLTGCKRYGKEKKGWHLRIHWFPQPTPCGNNADLKDLQESSKKIST